MDPLGLENITKAISALSPVLTDALDHAAMLEHGVLNRLNGTTITITINIPPAIGGKPPES